MVSPIGLVVFRKVFSRREREAEIEAEDFAREVTDHGDIEEA